MNLNRAKYILTILEEGSISAAAHRLFLSQAALSQTVKLVEDEVGLPILEREKGSLKLTFAGERYVDTVKQMMLLEKNFQNEIDEIKREERGKLRFGIPFRNGQLLLPRILPQFLKEHSAVQLEIVEKDILQLTRMTLQGDVDLAVIRTANFEKGLNYTLLQKDQMGILAGVGSRLYEMYPEGTSIDINQAVTENFVFLKKGHSSRTGQDKLLEKKKLHLRALVELDNFETAKQMVIRCGAVVIAPYSTLQRNEHEMSLTHFYPLKDAEDDGSLYLIHNESVYLTPYMKRWIELVKGAYNTPFL